MLNLALVALLSGTLVTGSPDGDRDKNRDKTQDQAAATEAAVAAPAEAVVELPQEAMTSELSGPEERRMINRNFAFGRANDRTPLKVWLFGGYGEAETAWRPDGESQDPGFDFVALRAGVGAQINVIRIGGGHLGVGGELIVAKNEIQFGSTALQGGDGTDLSSDFTLQNVNGFVHLGLNRDLAVFVGMAKDLGPDFDPNDEDNEDFYVSDERDAWFFGADFDYSRSGMWRVFAGVEYFLPQEFDDDSEETANRVANPPGTAFGGDGGGSENGDNILWWTAGLGLRFNAFEVGAALMVRSRLKVSEPGQPGSPSFPPFNQSGSHAGTIAPYLRISPGSFPVSLFVQGAVLGEYDAFGYAIGGGNGLKPALGLTAGLTLGFGGGDDHDDEMMMESGM